MQQLLRNLRLDTARCFDRSGLGYMFRESPGEIGSTYMSSKSSLPESTVRRRILRRGCELSVAAQGMASVLRSWPRRWVSETDGEDIYGLGDTISNGSANGFARSNATPRNTPEALDQFRSPKAGRADLRTLSAKYERFCRRTSTSLAYIYNATLSFDHDDPQKHSIVTGTGHGHGHSHETISNTSMSASASSLRANNVDRTPPPHYSHTDQHQLVAPRIKQSQTTDQNHDCKASPAPSNHDQDMSKLRSTTRTPLRSRSGRCLHDYGTSEFILRKLDSICEHEEDRNQDISGERH
jgi:hypothetical protein